MKTLDAVLAEGRKRLYPALTDPSWLVLRRRRKIFKAWFSRLDGRELDVLDVGGRLQPYRALLEGRLRRYVAVDLLSTPLVNIVGRGEQIPLASERFDLVICTQVLEYVPEPAMAIAEMHRVLKPGGCMVLSVPSMAMRDADEEYWRFLPHALRLLVGPFAESEVVPEGGSIIGFFRTVNGCLNAFCRYPILRTIFHWTLCPVLNLSGECLERMAGSDNDQFAANYSVWARKRTEG